MPFKGLFNVRNSLAFRLTIWYAFVFSISSLVAFLLLYLIITKGIRERVDRELSNQIGTFSSIMAVKGVDAVRKVIVLESKATGERKIFFRIFYKYNEVYFSSNMAHWKNIKQNNSAIEQLVDGAQKVFDSVFLPGRKDEIRIIYGVIGPHVVIQMGQSMDELNTFVALIKRIFFITILVLLFLSGLVGWFMARQALSGLGEVTKTAASISDGALYKRVPVKGKSDEIDLLATTFNKMLDRLQSLVKEMKEMNDNIAHDLKSPVTRIRGTAEIALTTGSSIEDYEIMAASTIEESDRLLAMINTMLFISESESGRTKVLFKEMNISAIIRDACELFQVNAEDKGIDLSCKLSGECVAFGDTQMFQRMIANLVDNAIKYTPAGGIVKIILDFDDEYVYITVKDTGVGISEKDLKHVFERFYRGDPSRSLGGSGLGLSLAQTIATLHGGHINVRSVVGKGSVFTVIIPNRIKVSLSGSGQVL